MADNDEQYEREFDELARREAAERGEAYVSPFDESAAAAAPADAGDVETPVAFGDVPPARKRGRARKSTGKKPGRPAKPATGKERRRPAAAAADAAGSPRVEGPPPPAAAPMPAAAIPAAQLVPLVKRLDSLISARAGTEPLGDAEANEGASVLGPLLHHYAPSILNSNQPWVPAALWVALTYGPRALDRMDKNERARLAQLRRDQEAAPAPSMQRFPESAAAAAPPVEAPAVPADAAAPVFTNPLADLPDHPITQPLG